MQVETTDISKPPVMSDSIIRIQCQTISTDVHTRNQQILHDNLKPLCENNGIPVFQQWRLESKKYVCGDTHCLCSKSIHKLYTIHNVFNGNVANPIGGDCIERWFRCNNIEADIKAAKKMDKMQRQGRYPCCVDGCTGYSYDVKMPFFGCKKCYKDVLRVMHQNPHRYSKYRDIEWGQLWKTNRGYCKWIYEHPCMDREANKYVKAWLKANKDTCTIQL